MWEPVLFTDNDLRAKSRYIAGGCIGDGGTDKNDVMFATLLRHTSDSCVAETIAESMTVSVILRPKAGKTMPRSAYVIVRAFSDNREVIAPASAFPLR